MEKRLFRNDHDKVLAGVCSGLADYMQVDITIIRLLFVLSAIFLAGGGLIVYLVMWIVVPLNNDPNLKFSKFNEYYQKNPDASTIYNSPNAFNNAGNSGQTKWNTENVEQNIPPDFSKFQNGSSTGKSIIGAICLVLGIFFLLHTLGLVPLWFNVFNLYKLWPIALIALGVSLIMRNRQKNDWENFKQANQSQPDAKKSEDIVIVDEEKKDENPPVV